MNLIEQLGGYEKAKNIYDKAPPQSDNYADGLYYEQWQSKSWVRFDGEQCTDCKKPENPIHLYSLYLALLEYRRQHNIFEVGDKVVFIESELKNPRLMTVIEVSEPVCGFLMAECSLGITNGFYPSRYRHATDEEIKAGKRLEVKSDNGI